MLNYYLHVLDGSREAARFSSSNNSFISNGTSIASFYYPPFYYQSVTEAVSTMEPVLLNPANPDDIVISVFSMDGTTPTRFPQADPNGWSLCAHYKANADDSAVLYLPQIKQIVPVNRMEASPLISAASNRLPPFLPICLSPPGIGLHGTQLQISAGDITTKLNTMTLQGTSLAATGVVVVEIFYNYPQLLKLPVLTSIVPDPMPLYVYSIMPLSSAQPTQVVP